jgi:hypothetical protein
MGGVRARPFSRQRTGGVRVLIKKRKRKTLVKVSRNRTLGMLGIFVPPTKPLLPAAMAASKAHPPLRQKKVS